MADIPCSGCGDPAVCAIMMYGPDGGTLDLCNTHAAEWAYGVVKGAYPGLAEMLDQLEAQGAAQDAPGEGAQDADAGQVVALPAGGDESDATPPKRGRKPQPPPEGAQGAQEPPEGAQGAAEVQGAEHRS